MAWRAIKIRALKRRVMRLKPVEPLVVIAPIVPIVRTTTTINNARKTAKIPHSVAIEPRHNANRAHHTAHADRTMAPLLGTQHEPRAQAIAAHATKINKA